MAISGLYRLPFFPQLKVLNDNSLPAYTEVLSLLLYWSVKAPDFPFKPLNHTYLIAEQLQFSIDDINAVLAALIREKLLAVKEEIVHPKEIKADSKDRLVKSYLADVPAIAAALNAHGVKISLKQLYHCADDLFDLYDVIEERKLPFMQAVTGRLPDSAAFDEAALRIAQVLVYAGEHTNLIDKGLAPGWRLLASPPISAQELAQRWLAPGERAVDLGFADGSFFMPDGSVIHNTLNYVKHSGKALEPKILACAVCLAAASIRPDLLKFTTDLNLAGVSAALTLLFKATGIKGTLADDYFLLHGGSPEGARQLRQEYKSLLESLN